MDCTVSLINVSLYHMDVRVMYREEDLGNFPTLCGVWEEEDMGERRGRRNIRSLAWVRSALVSALPSSSVLGILV